MTEIDTVSLLAQEYLHLQNVLESFDEKALTIKGWSVTVALAGVATAFIKRSKLILAFSGISGLLFFVLEGLWKTFQWAYEPRIELIEKAFTKGNVTAIQEFLAEKDFNHFQIYTEWWSAWDQHGGSQFVEQICKPNVYLPHAIVIGACVVLWIMWNWLARFQPPQQS